MMNITLEQAKAFVAFAERGSFAAAAGVLHKHHSAVVYAISNMEAQTDLVLLDRSAYRTTLTDAGRTVLAHAKNLLRVQNELEAACATLKSGWEPVIRIVFDGVVPAKTIVGHVRKLAAATTDTRVELAQEFLGRVETAFDQSQAHVMISVVPPTHAGLDAVPLAELPMRLVAARKHPLASARRVTLAQLEKHALLTVRGSDPRLKMPTSTLDASSVMHLNDFHSKKEAILAGLGYGWLPEALMERELAHGVLKTLALGKHSRHVLAPHAYVRAGQPRGRALSLLLEQFAKR